MHNRFTEKMQSLTLGADEMHSKGELQKVWGVLQNSIAK